jgi:hypothetical protein
VLVPLKIDFKENSDTTLSEKQSSVEKKGEIQVPSSRAESSDCSSDTEASTQSSLLSWAERNQSIKQPEAKQQSSYNSI